MIPLYIFKGKKEMSTSSVFLKIATYFKSFQQIQFASTYTLDFSYSQNYYKNIFYMVSKVEETLAFTSSVSDLVLMNPPVKRLLILTNVWNNFIWYFIIRKLYLLKINHLEAKANHIPFCLWLFESVMPMSWIHAFSNMIPEMIWTYLYFLAVCK